MTRLLQALFIARGLIAGPDTWTTGASARNAGNAPVSSMSTEAVCFCAIGAIRRGCTVDLDRGRVDYATEQEIGHLLDAEVVRQYGAMPHPIDGGDTGLIIGINDFKGRRATLVVFDAVIARLQRLELIERLKAARALITPRESWTTHRLARTSDHTSVDPLVPDACSFCAIGAAIRVTGEDAIFGTSLVNALDAATRRLHANHASVVGVNDKEGHAATLRVYDEAIASARIATLSG